jgi:hypothetical protein
LIDRVDDARWQRRATRARRLAGERPAVADTLYFYAELAELQERLLHRFPQLITTPSPTFADRLDPGAALTVLPELLAFIRREAPAPLASELGPVRDDEFDRWRHRIQTYWITGGREAWDATAIQRFVLEALLQPFAESVAAEIAESAPPRTHFPPPAVAESATGPAPSLTVGDHAVASRPHLSPNVIQGAGPVAGSAIGGGGFCQICSGLPVVALLREQAHGAKRSLVCGLCLTEWPSPRLACPHCGESTFESLPVFRSDEFDAVRIDGCDSCQSYVKTIDRTRDGEASPIVDDLASMPLDLWAREKGYRRVRPNLFGF